MRVTRFGRWLENRFGGSRSFTVPLTRWRVTVYGFNAMHVAVNIRTRRWGMVCFHPPMRCFGVWWPWKFYLSLNGTPWAAYRTVGPGIDAEDRKNARIRRLEGRCACRGTRDEYDCYSCGYPVVNAVVQ